MDYVNFEFRKVLAPVPRELVEFWSTIPETTVEPISPTTVQAYYVGMMASRRYGPAAPVEEQRDNHIPPMSPISEFDDDFPDDYMTFLMELLDDCSK